MSAWKYEIKYGPEGETDYAWIYKGDLFVATMRTHHAVEIVRALSAIEPAGVGVETPPPSTHLAGIVPEHCSGYSFVFEPGVLHVKKDGSGHIVVNEEDFALEDDRDGEGGSIHWIARMGASEMTALRDFLNGIPQQHLRGDAE